MSYADQAAEYLHEHRIPTDESLQAVLQRWCERQVGYYCRHAQGIDKEKRQLLAEFFVDIPRDGTIDKEDIKFALMKEHSEEKNR